MVKVSPPQSNSVPCPEEAVFVDLLRTADQLSRGPAQFLKSHDLSPNQYNVLRILRGSRDGLLCGDLASRMITRDPDITRLLDRLENRRLIARDRQDCDRRKVLARITQGGIDLLARLDEPICAIHRRQLDHLGKGQLRLISRLLIACRSGSG
jgi:DNA-binding MarR family transcriptional regulator